MININIKTETPIWARELTEDQLSFYPALPGYEHEIDMPAYQNCMKDSRNCVDDDVKHKNIVVFVVLEEIGKFEKLWGSRCPGKEHLMWPLVGYNVYGRLGVPISCYLQWWPNLCKLSFLGQYGLSTKSRKRRSEKAIFEQSGPLLPQHLENQSLTSGAHDCQQTPAPSTRSQAHRQTSERQNLRNNQQQNPVELPPMNRPPPPYVPVQQQYPTPSEAPAPPTYNFNFQNFSEIFKNHLMSIVGYSPEKMRLVRSVLNQTACILDGDLPQNCSQSQIFQKLNSLFPNKNRPN
ncbi:hypothetical protein L3Y34_019654 [Caenorhabditis briggsae]|uniref:Uncharacterized protein n=1 Tax=Caenorhabditis briggsae TaxID=6238 RepID=A0AAE9DRF4_CAEBR|nr:hypothetical protein L3Y34_019654 [Caenorhabditis briggsae]